MLLSLAAALAVTAQSFSPWLDEARALVEQLRFADAIARLEVARQVRSLEPKELREVLELLAYCQVAEGRRDAAEATFTAMLQADPWLKLSRDSSSPKVLESFEAAKARLFAADYVRLEEKPSPPGWATVVLIDPWGRVSAVTLFTRRDNSEWRQNVLTEESDHSYRFALTITVGEQFEWYVEAQSDVGAKMAFVGTREEPRVIRVVRPDPQALITPLPGMKGSRVAGFMILGAGVLLGAVATGLEVGGWNLRQAARNRSRPPGDFADTARLAEREGQSQQTWAAGLFIGAGVMTATGVVLAW
jgi:hypothetical protein